MTIDIVEHAGYTKVFLQGESPKCKETLVSTVMICGIPIAEQTKPTATLEAGEKFEFKPNEYFEGLPEDVKTKDFKIDDSKLDNTKPGKYDVRIL